MFLFFFYNLSLDIPVKLGSCNKKFYILRVFLQQFFKTCDVVCMCSCFESNYHISDATLPSLSFCLINQRARPKDVAILVISELCQVYPTLITPSHQYNTSQTLSRAGGNIVYSGLLLSSSQASRPSHHPPTPEPKTNQMLVVSQQKGGQLPTNSRSIKR